MSVGNCVVSGYVSDGQAMVQNGARREVGTADRPHEEARQDRELNLDYDVVLRQRLRCVR